MNNKLSYKFSYRRRLPHIQPEGATFFVTSRLAGSLLTEVVHRLMQEKENINRELEKIDNINERLERANSESPKLFEKWDHELDNSTTDVNFLGNALIANIVEASLHFRDGKEFELIAFCIMPNHIHLVFTPWEETKGRYFSLSKIMHSFKRYTAYEANLVLGRKGTFWQHESYDHFIRDSAELERTVKYVLYNPVKANLVKEQSDWKWSYCKYGI